jgi:hypothetical protein
VNLTSIWIDVAVGFITAKAISARASCPLCKVASRPIHSRYVRRVSDLPCACRGVRLDLVALRFRCEQPLCRRQIFAERFDKDVVHARSRLMMRASNDTLLRTVRRRSQRPTQSLKVVGIDDWASRKLSGYSPIVRPIPRRTNVGGPCLTSPSGSPLVSPFIVTLSTAKLARSSDEESRVRACV